MSQKDPYLTVRDEVYSQFRQLEHEKKAWQDMCMNGSAPQINAAKKDAEATIGEISAMLNDLSRANSVAERDLTKIGITLEDHNGRKKWVENYLEKLRVIQDELLVPPEKVRLGVAGKPTKGQRIQAAIEKDNDEYINNQEQVQQEMFAQHDQHFDTIHENIREIGQMGRIMGETLEAHNHILDKANEEADETTDMISQATKKVEKLIERMGGNCGWVCIGVLIAIFALVSFLALTLPV